MSNSSLFNILVLLLNLYQKKSAQPKVSETSEIEELNLWLADPLLRKEVMPRIMKGDRYSVEFDDDGEPLRVVEVKS